MPIWYCTGLLLCGAWKDIWNSLKSSWLTLQLKGKTFFLIYKIKINFSKTYATGSWMLFGEVVLEPHSALLTNVTSPQAENSCRICYACKSYNGITMYLIKMSENHFQKWDGLICDNFLALSGSVSSEFLVHAFQTNLSCKVSLTLDVKSQGRRHWNYNKSQLRRTRPLT